MARDLQNYFQEVEILDRAIGSERGISMSFVSKEAAIAFRHRLHKCRGLARKIEDAGREADDPKRGTSVYESIRVSGPLFNSNTDKWTLQLLKLESPIPGLMDVYEI